jgi:hypothetical protein
LKFTKNKKSVTVIRRLSPSSSDFQTLLQS